MSENADGLPNPEIDTQRYSRQIRFAPIGIAGQQKLSESTVAIIGCGALGSIQASTMVRAGVGRVRLIDRDFLEASNLQRQFLYDENDIESGWPKSVAAKLKLDRINSQVTIENAVEDLNESNIDRLCGDANILLDGTDNFETRFLINDFAVHRNKPWIFGGCIGCDGQSMTIVPGETACLHCLMMQGPPPPGTAETCDSAGILATIIGLIASFQCNEAFKIMTGHMDKINHGLLSIGLWENDFRIIDLSELSNVDCPVCSRREFKWLHGDQTSKTAVLCGRNAVQLSYTGRRDVDLSELEKRLRTLGRTRLNEFMLQVQIENYSVTVFPDGRAIIKGTEDIAKAKSLYSQWIGN